MAEADNIYILNVGNSQSEHERLNIQHRFFDDMMNNDLLPPHIASSLAASPSPRVLEMATGTGVWLDALAKTLPSHAELVGLDYDTSKFPPSSAISPNITLQHGDMYKPFPAHLLGKFDVVNVRLIIYALKGGHGTELIKNLMTLLKPGGWVVWSESGASLATADPPSMTWFKFQELNLRFAKAVGADLDLPLAMVYYMKQAGCVECEDRAYPGSAQLFTKNSEGWIPRCQENLKVYMKQVLQGMISLGGVEGMMTLEDANALLEMAEKDFVGDRKFNYLPIRAWGRTPTS